MAPFRLQLVKLLQVFGKLVRFYHGAIQNTLVHLLMQGVGKGSIVNVVEFEQRLQGHGKHSQLWENFLLFCSFDHHEASSAYLAQLAPHAKDRYSTGILFGNGACTRRRRLCSWLFGSQFVGR
ncbi:hypothetical protein TNCV_1699311 [Trichonephila clavipes]|nr:hypothetical protein TNCV_1699311 [Trichonephila clavipes]